MHPLHMPVKLAARCTPKCHHSPLHWLLHLFKLKQADIETISEVRQHPNWSPLIMTHIMVNKKEATSMIYTRMDDLKVFTDRSGY